MSTVQSASSNLPQFIFSLSSTLSWDSAAAAVTTVEAAFYGSLKGGIQNAGKLVNWIRETSIAHIHAIQVIFNVANVGIVLLYTSQLVDKAFEKFSFLEIFGEETAEIYGKVSMIAALAVTVALGILGLNHLSPALANKRQEGEVEISEKLSTQQKIAKILHTSKLVLTFALAFFVKNPLWQIVSLAGSGYSLWKNVQLKWISFSTQTNYFDHVVNRVDATYHMLVLPPAGEAVKDECAICLEDQTDMTFCANHVFHQTCITEQVKTKSALFTENLQLLKMSTDHYTNHCYTHTSHAYSATIPQENLPSCPCCREIPLQNGCDIQVTDRVHGVFEAQVTIDRPPMDHEYLYEHLYPIYTIVQAGLAFLQTYPALAATIFKIQTFMMVTDCIGFALTAYYLYHKICEKFELQDRLILKVAAAVMLIATAALSYFAVLHLTAYLKSTLVLKDFLSDLQSAPGMNAQGIEVSWHFPPIHQLMQCLYINRIVASVALAYFSKQKMSHLISVAAQIGSMIGISKLKWIAFSQTLKLPLQKIVAEGGRLLGNLQQSSLKLITYSLVDLSKNAKSILESIYRYSTSFFQKSVWERYWWNTYRNGFLMSSELRYDIGLQNSSLELFNDQFSLSEYSIHLIDAIYGNAQAIARAAN